MKRDGKLKASAFDSFEEFRVAFDASIEAVIKSRRTAGLIPVLRRRLGFVLSADQTEELLATIRGLPSADSLQLTILLESRLKSNVSNALARLGSEIVAQYIRETNFSDFFQGDDDTETKGQRAIDDWLQQLVRNSDPNAKSKAVLSERRLRSAFGCLLLLVDSPEFAEMVLRLLRLYAESSLRGYGRMSIAKPSFSLAKTVGALLMTEKPKSSRIRLLLNATDWLQLEMKRLADTSRQWAERVESLDVKLSSTDDELVRSKETLVEMKKEATDLTNQVDRLESRLREEGARATSIEEHWQAVMQQELAGFSHRVRKQLEHEVNEIRLCLERGNPNVEMALNRANRILSIIPTTEAKP